MSLELNAIPGSFGGIVNPEMIEIPLSGFPRDPHAHNLPTANRLFLCAGTAVLKDVHKRKGEPQLFDTLVFTLLNNEGSPLVFDVRNDETIYRATTHLSLNVWNSNGERETLGIEFADTNLNDQFAQVTGHITLAGDDMTIDRVAYQDMLLARKFDEVSAAGENPPC